jgi:hypothetical protein
VWAFVEWSRLEVEGLTEMVEDGGLAEPRDEAGVVGIMSSQGETVSSSGKI